ncbi:MAG: hypothetical protein JOZ54_11710 [Acidobacteria bacterium]|nr:hypothetical protein [Acidobacteriota bacterium]
MKVGFHRSGGFAGLSLKSEVDCSQLPPGKCKELEQLVGLLRAAGQPAPSPSKSSYYADAFQYEVTVQDDDGTQKYRAGDGEMSPEMEKVVDWLTAHARG